MSFNANVGYDCILIIVSPSIGESFGVIPTIVKFIEFYKASASKYDMIICRDLLEEFGIILNFNDRTVTWDRYTTSMKDRYTLNSQESLIEV
jgi:hypothetical protein